MSNQVNKRKWGLPRLSKEILKLPIKTPNAWVRGAPKRLTTYLYIFSRKNARCNCEEIVKQKQITLPNY
jgi:hypothetical protein